MATPVIVEKPPLRDAPSLRGTFANLASVIAGEGFLRVANFLVAVLIAREYGTSLFGLYATSLAYATIAVMIADNGLQISAITSINGSPDRINEIVGRLYLAKSLPLIPVVLGAAALLWAFHAYVTVWTVAGVITLRTTLQAYCQLQVAILKAIDRMQSIAAVQMLHFVALTAGAFAVYWLRLPIHNLMEVLMGAQIIEFAASLARVRNAGIRPLGGKISEAVRLLRNSTPFGVSFTIASFFLRMDVIVLAWIVPVREIGHFAAAQQVLVAVYLISWLFGSVLLPELVRLSSSPKALHAYVGHWVLLLSVTSIPVAIIGAAGGSFFMRVVYGQAFASAGRPFVILCLTLPFVMLNALYLNRAIALGARSLYVTTYVVAAAAGIIADLVFTLTLGITGTAVAALLREVGMFGFLHLIGGPKRSEATA